LIDSITSAALELGALVMVAHRERSKAMKIKTNVKAGAFNAFANFGDIKGESTDKDHKDWVMIL
jgi:hypothetical protein